MNKQTVSSLTHGNKNSKKETLYPVFGEQQVYSCICYDVHAEFKGQDLSGFPWCGNITHFHWLIVCRQEELPKTVPMETEPIEYS